MRQATIIIITTTCIVTTTAFIVAIFLAMQRLSELPTVNRLIVQDFAMRTLYAIMCLWHRCVHMHRMLLRC